MATAEPGPEVGGKEGGSHSRVQISTDFTDTVGKKEQEEGAAILLEIINTVSYIGMEITASLVTRSFNSVGSAPSPAITRAIFRG